MLRSEELEWRYTLEIRTLPSGNYHVRDRRTGASGVFDIMGARVSGMLDIKDQSGLSEVLWGMTLRTDTVTLANLPDRT